MYPPAAGKDPQLKFTMRHLSSRSCGKQIVANRKLAKALVLFICRLCKAARQMLHVARQWATVITQNTPAAGGRGWRSRLRMRTQLCSEGYETRGVKMTPPKVVKGNCFYQLHLNFFPPGVNFLSPLPFLSLPCLSSHKHLPSLDVVAEFIGAANPPPQKRKNTRLGGLLRAQLSITVGDLDPQLFSPLHNRTPLPGGHVVCDLCADKSIHTVRLSVFPSR